MLDDFLKYIQKKSLVNPAHKILLAVSGGIDSMTMAFLFHKAGFDFTIAHCNFRLRGDESENDRLFVKKYAAQIDKDFLTINFDTKQYSEKQNISIQMAARELRYNWFNELAEHYHFNCIAIAHNRDDIVETFMINLSRGTGLAGLTGLKPKRDRIIRPLLFASREEINLYSKNENILFREDSSNKDIKYQRNLIRHKITPLFKKLNPSFSDTIIRETEIFSSTLSIYQKGLESIINEITLKETSPNILSIPKILSLSLKPPVLFDILARYGFSYSDIVSIYRSLKRESGKSFYSATHILVKDRKTLLIERRKNENLTQQSIIIDENCIEISHPLKLKLEYSDYNRNNRIPKLKETVALDYNKLKYPLRLRTWREGDRFTPLGMKGTKKLSDFFIDRKINLLEKKNIWLLISDYEIVWIIGHQINDHYKVTNSTKKLLIISLKD